MKKLLTIFAVVALILATSGMASAATIIDLKAKGYKGPKAKGQRLRAKG